MDTLRFSGAVLLITLYVCCGNSNQPPASASDSDSRTDTQSASEDKASVTTNPQSTVDAPTTTELAVQTEKSARKWTDATGKYSVEATLVEVKDGIALLRKASGKITSVPIARLSTADQQFLERLTREPLQGRETEGRDPGSLADLEPKDVRPEENAAAYLGRIIEDSRKLLAEIHPHALPNDFNWRVGLTEAQVKRTEQGFEAYSNVLVTLELAARCKRHAWPVDYTVTTDKFIESFQTSVNHSRTFARLHDCRARYLAATGKHDEAAMMCLRQLRLCRLQDEEPLLLGFLVNVACRSIAVHSLNGILQTSNLTLATHEAIEEELAKHDAMECLVHAIKTDRAIGIENFRSLTQQEGVPKAYLDNYRELMDQQIAMGAKSHFELADTKRVAAKGIAQTTEPGLMAAREAMNRTRAIMRCLRVLNVIHSKATSAEVSIDDLGLPEQITIDSYNGKPLNIKSTAKGWVIYSVAKNRKDDGGTLKDLADIGVGPPEVMDF